MLTLAILLAVTTAEAGKLHDDNGFRGRKFGHDAMTEPPMEGCARGPEAGIPWVCPTTIGGVKADVHYAVDEGVFHTVLLDVQTYADCYGLKDVLVAAWGEPEKENPYIEKYVWREWPVVGTFEYNQFSKSCTVLVMNIDLYKEMRSRKEQKANAAVQDL
jgi:hypothetical protein